MHTHMHKPKSQKHQTEDTIYTQKRSVIKYVKKPIRENSTKILLSLFCVAHLFLGMKTTLLWVYRQWDYIGENFFPLQVYGNCR